MSVDKELFKGCSKTIVLKLLSTKAMHGYEIAQQLKAHSGGMIEITEGTMYPLLHGLEADRAISSEWVKPTGQRKKRVYKLTALGRKLLQEKTQNWQQFMSTMETLMAVKHQSVGVWS